MESKLDVRDFLIKNISLISEETENSLTLKFTFPVNKVDSSELNCLEKHLINDFIVKVRDIELTTIKSVNDLKNSYGKDDGYLKVDDLATVFIEFKKSDLMKDINLENKYFFSTIEQLEKNINYLQIKNKKKKLFVGILLNIESKFFDSGFIVIDSYENIKLYKDEYVSQENYNEYEKTDKLYDIEKLSDYLEYSNAWYNKYVEKHDKLMSFLFKKQVNHFFHMICNKYLDNKTDAFVIRGYKTIILNIDNVYFSKDAVDIFYRLTIFYISAENYTDKLKIIRNTFSLFLDSDANGKNLNEKIDEISKSIYYNFDLYIQKKVKIFIEQKNAAIGEFNKAAQEVQKIIDDMTSQNRTILLSLLGTVFLSILDSIDSSKIYIINLVMLSYAIYFISNGILMLNQKKHVEIIINNLENQIKSLGIKIDDDGEKKLKIVFRKRERSSQPIDDDKISFSKLYNSYLVTSIRQFVLYRFFSISFIFTLGLLFFLVYLSTRFQILSFFKIAIKWLIGY